MARLTVYYPIRLSVEERQALDILADFENRRPADMLRSLLRERARERGVLPMPMLSKVETRAPQEEAA